MVDLSFNFNEFTANLAKQREIQEQRQAAEIAKAKRDAALKQRSVELGQDYNRQVDPLRRSIQTTIQKKDHARKLADSGNPVDTLRLMGLQLMDPGGYTQERRQARLQEDMQLATAIGQVHDVAQGALELEMLSTGNEVNQLKVQETIGLEKLTRYATEAGMLTQNLEAARRQKDAILESIPTEQLRAAALAAQGNNGKVNIQGMDIDAESIANRIDANEQIRIGRLERQAIRERMEFIDLDPTIRKKQLENERRAKMDEIDSFDQRLAITQAERRVALDAAQNVEHDLAWKQRERKIQAAQMTPEATDQEIFRINEESRIATEEVLRHSQLRHLRSLTDRQIVQIQKNNNRDESGEAFNPADLQAVFDEKQKALQNDLTLSQRDHMLKNFGMTTLANENARLEQIMPNLPTGSVAAQAAVRHQQNLALAAKYADSPNEALKMQALSVVEESQKIFDETLQKQAKAEARGDANLEQLRLAYYRGQPIPEAELRNAIKERLLKGQSFADVLPTQAVTQVRRRFTEIENQLIAERQQANGFGTSLSSDDRKAIKQEAADMAIDAGVTDLLQQRTDDILSGQVSDPTNPLAQMGMKPNDVAVVLATADAQAKQRWAMEMELTPEQVEMYDKGQPIPGKTRSTLRAALRHLENAELFENLNGRSPGLGQEYANWWQTRGPQYVAKNQQYYESNTGTNFNDVSMRTIARSHETQSMLDYAMSVSTSNPAVIEEHAKRRSEFLTFGGNPEHQQVMLLHYAEHLQDDEKAMFFQQVIQPTLRQAQQRGMDFKQTSLMVERAIEDDELVANNPELKRIARSLRRDRAANVQKLNDLLELGSMFEQGRSMPGLGKAMEWTSRAGGIQRPNTNPYSAKVGWYLELQNQNAQVPR